MFAAFDSSRSRRLALPEADRPVRQFAEVVEPERMRQLAKAGELRCSDPHCDEPLLWRQGSEHRRAHLAHPPGTAASCAEVSGPEGAWHRHVKLDIFGAAFAHESDLVGNGTRARADVIMSRRNGNLFGVEIQHSPIKPEIVDRRHLAHAAAGLTATMWILDGQQVGIANTPAWCDETRDRLGDRFVRGRGVTSIRTAWAVDLIRVCREAGKAHPVGVITRADLLGPETLRFIDRGFDDVDEDGSVCFRVTKWSKPFLAEVLTLWAAGPGRPNGVNFRQLDSAPGRSVTDESCLFDVEVSGTQVSIGFDGHHFDFERACRDAGMLPFDCGCGPRSTHRLHMVGDIRDPVVAGVLTKVGGIESELAA